MPLPLERRRQLQALGLRALIKRRFGPEVGSAARVVPYGGGAAIVAGAAPEAAGLLAAVFADSPTGLGSAVDLAAREGAGHLYFFAELNTPAVARRAAEFALPVTVVDPGGDFQALESEPHRAIAPPPSRLASAREWLRAAGLDVEWEDGVLLGELLGLEVARATDLGLEGVVLDVGVGKHDREANRLLYPDGPTDELLAHAVSVVAELRRPNAPVHPANQLAPERWLRAVIRNQPSLVGLDAVRSGPSPEPRPDLRGRSVAPGWGYDAAGEAVVVACSVGVDPDVVALAADARLQAPAWPDFPSSERPARLLIVVPEGDDHPLTRRVAGLLTGPADVVTVAADWRAQALR